MSLTIINKKEALMEITSKDEKAQDAGVLVEATMRLIDRTCDVSIPQRK